MITIDINASYKRDSSFQLYFDVLYYFCFQPDLPIYVAIKGIVFDVSEAKSKIILKAKHFQFYFIQV